MEDGERRLLDRKEAADIEIVYNDEAEDMPMEMAAVFQRFEEHALSKTKQDAEMQLAEKEPEGDAGK